MNQFTYWIWLMPFGWVIGLFSSNPKLRRMTMFLLLCILTYFIIISASKTKLEWYTAPLYPLMAFSVAILLNWFFEFLKRSEFFQIKLGIPVVGYAMLFLVFILPYRNILDKVYHPKNIESINWVNEIPDYLKHVVESHGNVDGCKVVFTWAPSSILFYQKELNEMNQHITLDSAIELKEDDYVIVSQDDIYDKMLRRFTMDTVEVYHGVWVIHLNHLR